uniref:Si:dkey-21h14.12 n=1 Tax=Sinocyclocheilus grahami TaxID=75366 RepID=A0A672KQF3_SINGR
MVNILLLYAHFMTYPSWTDRVNVRLVNGDSRCAGRVEVLHDGQWGTVCHFSWDMTDAAVVCRELSCGEALQAPGNSYFGPGSGKIWMDGVKCKGSESTLKDYNNVGLICSGKMSLLANGLDICSGRVERQYFSKWGTVCDACWEMRAASILCKQLNCGIAVSVVGSDWFGEGSGEIWADVFDCDGNETKLSECSISSWSRAECSHRRDVGVICSSEFILLFLSERQCEGEVEVFIHQVWRRVLLDSWSLTESSVVCRQLGCGSVLNFYSSSSSSPEHSHECVTGFQCSGSEAHMGNCSSPQTLNCSSTQQLSITFACYSYNFYMVNILLLYAYFMTYPSWTDRVNVRLVNGDSRCAGRVEVLHRGQWGTVCHFSWDMTDAAVVCRELSCGEALQAPRYSYFGPGSGKIWMDGVKCKGSESTLKDCGSKGWGKHSDICGHNNVGLICSGYTDLRLANGLDICSGRVERQYFSKWGTVCDACWEMRAASILCKQLNCGIAVSVVGSDWFGEGSGEIWADVFDCDGNETKLSECSISSWSRAECSHRQDVGVISLHKLSTAAPHNSRGSIRLVGSGGDCAGRLEVFHSGSWGAVCDDSWDIKDAHVVCRQLQCGVALSNQQVPAWFGPGSGPIWLDEVECEGNETSLWSCSSPGWGKHDCQHKEDVGVVCSGKQYTRGNVLPCINVIPPPPQQKRLMHVANAVSILCQAVKGMWRFSTMDPGEIYVTTR